MVHLGGFVFLLGLEWGNEYQPFLTQICTQIFFLILPFQRKLKFYHNYFLLDKKTKS